MWNWGEGMREVLLTVLPGGALTVCAFVLGDAQFPDEINWIMRWALAAVAFVSYVAGALAATLAARRRLAQSDSALVEERRRADMLDGRVAAMDEQREYRHGMQLAREQYRRDDFRERVSPAQKSFVARLMAEEYVDVDGLNLRSVKEACCGKASQYVVAEDMGNGTIRLRMRDYGREFLTRNPELLEGYKSEV